MGIVHSAVNNHHANSYLVDEMAHFTIFSRFKIKASSEYQAAMIGDELIYFRHVRKISENIYKISSFIRGAKFTDILDHKIGERFVMMENVSEIPISDMLEKTTIKFSALSKEKSLNFRGLCNNSL